MFHEQEGEKISCNTKYKNVNKECAATKTPTTFPDIFQTFFEH